MENYYDELIFGDRPPSTDIEYIGKELAPKKNYVEAALEESMIPFAAKRLYDRRSSQFEEEKDFTITPEMDTEIKANFSEKDEEYLRGAKSKTEYLAKQRFIKEDKERLSAMASGGWKGIGAMLAFSVMDPTNIAMSSLTGGIGWLQKGTGLARAAKLGMSAGLENVVLDGMLMQGQTQSEASDLIMSFGAGAVMGSAIGALSKGAKGADIAAHVDSDSYIVNKTVGEGTREVPLPIKKAYPEADVRAMQTKLDAYEKSLTRETSGAMTKGQVKQVRKRMVEVKKKIDVENERVRASQGEVTDVRQSIFDEQKTYVAEAKAGREAVVAKHADRITAQEARLAKVEDNIAKKPDSTKQAAKLYKEEFELDRLKKVRQAEIDKLEAKLKGKVTKAETAFNKKFSESADAAKVARTSLTDEMASYSDRLKRAGKAKQSANDIRKWKQMSQEEKIKAAYGDEEIPNMKVELERQIDAQNSFTRSGAPEASTIKPRVEGETGSAGAARIDETVHTLHDLEFDSKKKLSELAYDGTRIPEDLRGRGLLLNKSKFARMLHSASTVISNSKDFAIRGFGYHLFEAPQGGRAAKVTVASRVQHYGTLIRSAMKYRLDEGLEEWGKANGLSVYDTLMNHNNFRSYHKSVMLEALYPGTHTDDAIKKGAQGCRDQLDLAGEMRKEAGEYGFKDLKFHKNYMPIIINEKAVKLALNSNSSHKIEKLISKGYQEGAYKLNDKLADRLAEAYVQRSKNHTLSMSDAIRHTKDSDLEDVAKQLEKAGVDSDVIEDFLETSLDKELKDHMSNRAKKSLQPDLRVEYGGLKLIDFVDHDLPKLMESYTRDSVGGIAFGKLGYGSKREVEDVLIALEKGAENNGFNPTRIGEEIQILRDGVEMAYGRSLNKNPGSKAIKRLSMLRDATSLLRLQFNGAASVPELSRSLTQRGIKTTMEACKDLGAFRGTKNLREGGKYSGSFKRPDLREMEIAMGFAGEDERIVANGLRADDIEEAAGTLSEGWEDRVERYLDNALAQGRRVQEVASGFRIIQGGGERIAIRSVGIQIKKWAGEGGKAMSEANINRAGWHDGFLDEVKDFMQKHPKTENFEGQDMTLFNFGEMAPEMEERLVTGMQRLARADMLRPYIGETPMFMNKWLGQTLTQFRSFSISSIEKQLVADIRHDKHMSALMAMNSAMLSYASLGVVSMQRHLGKEDAAELVEADVSGFNAVHGVARRMGVLAGAAICEDVLATVGVLPEAMMKGNGARAMGMDSIPVVGMVDDFMVAPKEIIHAMTGSEKGSLKKAVGAVQDIIPFAKSIGINQAFTTIENQLK